MDFGGGNGEDNEIKIVAKLNPELSFVCLYLKIVPHGVQKAKGKERSFNKQEYGFDLSKVDQIFDILLRDKQIVLRDDHKIPSPEQRKGRKYCKYHNKWNHWTNNNVHFRDLIQGAFKAGRLKFEEKANTMKVDTDPFDNSAT